MKLDFHGQHAVVTMGIERLDLWLTWGHVLGGARLRDLDSGD